MKPYRILSIDGGGMRGVFAAQVLKEIEAACQIDLPESFDMFTGTSTGSIIAAGIASGLSAAKVLEFYETHAATIFKVQRPKLAGLFYSAYSNSALKEILDGIFQETTLAELKKPLLIPVTDISTGEVYVLNSTKPDDGKTKLSDAVLASCSAPTFFQPVYCRDLLLADGGLWANNPSLVAVLEVRKHFGVDLDAMRVLSIGPGYLKQIYDVRPRTSWGVLFGWEGMRFLELLIAVQSKSAEHYTEQLLDGNQIIRINFESDQTIPIDDSSIIANLIQEGKQAFDERAERIKAFMA